MTESLRTLLDGVIDYAGLFPPAKLDLRTAYRNYRRYQSGPESWIVSRFVCPTSQLNDLQALVAADEAQSLVPITAIGTASKDDATWEDALENDAQVMTRFNDALEGRAEIQAFEIKIPDNKKVERYVRDLSGFDAADVYVELAWDEDMTDAIGTLIDSDWLGAKGRTGGLTPDAFPDPIKLAEFLHECHSGELPYKLTAGLHHPFRGTRDGLPMHGFLNVLVATALIDAEQFSRTQVAAVLSEEDRSAFEFSDDWVAWRGHRADLDTIEEMRDLLVGFGSCSVDEPLQDLAAEGLN